MRAVSRAIAILRAFTSDLPYRSLAEIAESADLDPATTRRILVTLRDNGLVRQDERSGRYCLTIGVMRLASGVPDGSSLRDLTESELVTLASDTGTTSFLSIERDDFAICLARYHSQTAVQVRWWSVGGALPLNCGAAPKVLFAHLPEERREAILRSPFEQLTPKSMVDPEALRAELEVIRKRGWALAQDDVAEGLAALAAPLRDSSGKVIAAISVGGLTPHVLGNGESRLLPRLLKCAEGLSDRLLDLWPETKVHFNQ